MKRKQPQPNPLYNVITKPLNRKFLRHCLLRAIEDREYFRTMDYDSQSGYMQQKQKEVLSETLRATTAHLYNYLYYRAHCGWAMDQSRKWKEITGDEPKFTTKTTIYGTVSV